MAALPNTWATGNSYTAVAQNAVANAVNGLNQSGVYASRPAAGFPGALYFCTDNGNVYCDNGTTWDLRSLGGFGVAGVEPPSASWTTNTLSTATVAADKGARLFTVPSVAGTNWRVEYRTLSPTSGYTATVNLQGIAPLAGLVAYGIVLYNATSNSFFTFGNYCDASGGNNTLIGVKWTNSTTGNGFYGTALSGTGLSAGIPTWLRVRDDATNRFFEYSNNGIDWMLHNSIGRTDFITPDRVGWGCTNSSGATALVRLRSFSVV